MTVAPALLLPWLLAALAVAALVAARFTPDRLARSAAVLRGPFAPAAVGCACMLFSWWLWGTLDAVPVVHDEAAYVLQAEIFARGRWALPSPPLPEFFEQFHVFVTPVLAPKYPPGHGLFLVPGVWLGAPGLVPVILSGLTGAFLFVLARRATEPAAALLAVWLWLTAPTCLAFRPSYFSELTTGWLVLLAWWALLRWCEDERLRWLLLVSVAVAWGAISRPLTMLAFALPIGACVLTRAWRARLGRQVALATLAGLLVLALLPLQSVRVTGDWRLTPYRHYSEVYFPFDVPGFDKDYRPPSRALPPDMTRFCEVFEPAHRAHTVSALPRSLALRTLAVLRGGWGDWWVGMAPLFVLGLLIGTAPVAVAAASAALLMLAYLCFAHPPGWTLYYLEVQAIIACITALGAWRAARWIAGFVRAPAGAEAALARDTVALVLLALLLLPVTWQTVRRIRANRFAMRGVQTSFRTLMADAPVPSLVFVRYAPDHDLHFSLITNVPDRAAARSVVVYDHGPRNAALLAHFPERVPYLFDEQSGRLFEMDRRTGEVDEELVRSARAASGNRPEAR